MRALICLIMLLNVELDSSDSKENEDKAENSTVEILGVGGDGALSIKLVSLYRFHPSESNDDISVGTKWPCQEKAIGPLYMDYNETDDQFYYKAIWDDFDGSDLLQITLPGEPVMCPIRIDYFKLYCHWIYRLGTIRDISIAGGDLYQCEIHSTEKCNAYSTCSTDECGCQNRGKSFKDQVMFCPSNSGGKACIAFENVCDGSMDCADQSDECLCQDSYKLQCQKIPQIFACRQQSTA